MSKAVLYSQSSDVREDLRRIAAAIDPAEGTLFRTRAFSGDAGAAWGSSWLEAARHPEHCGWELVKYSLIPDVAAEGGIAERRATLHRNICFYDALCEAARFEVAAQEQGLNVTGKSAGQDDEDYLVNFARAAGIPFDNAGMPLLAAGGRIMADGTYSLAAREVARRAAPVRTQKTLKSPALPSVFDYDTLDVAPPSGRQLVSVDPDSLEAQRAESQASIKAALLCQKIEAVEEWLRVAHKHNFVWCKDKSILWCPLIPIVGQVAFVCYMLGGERLLDEFPRTSFNRACAKLEREVIALPPQSAEPLNRYVQEARLAFLALQARSAGRQCVSGKKSERYMKRCLASFEHAAGTQGWDEQKIVTMRNLIVSDLKSQDFDQKILTQLEKQASKLTRYLRELPAKAPALLAGR